MAVLFTELDCKSGLIRPDREIHIFIGGVEKHNILEELCGNSVTV